MAREDQFAGCILGQALGDALGLVVEGYGAGHCTAYVADYLRAGRAGDLGRAPYPFGQYSDDTQLARELLRSIVDCGAFDPTHYAGLVAAIFVENRVVGRGRSTEAAAMRLARGVPWQEAGTPAPTAGNGSAMRAAPIGLWCSDDPGALSAQAHDQGRMTHADPRCSAGAAVIAGAVAICLRETTPDRTSMLAELQDLAAERDPRFARELGKMTGWLAMEPSRAGREIARAGLEEDFADDGWQGIAPFVVPSVLWSLYAFLRSPEEYWETICTAIAVGGDVDTTAAMAGAISGAHNGLTALPAHLTERLTDQGDWGTAKLVELARRCHALQSAQRRPRRLFQSE